MSRGWIGWLPAGLRGKLEENPQLRAVLGNSGWLLADNVLRMGVGFLVTIWLTRYLGPEQYGILSYALTLVLLFSPVAQLGLDAVVVRNLVREPDRRDEILGSAFVLRLAGGAVSVLLSLAVVWMLRPGDPLTQLLVGIVALGALFQSFGVVDFWFQAQVRSRYTAAARSVACLLASALKIGLILAQAPLLAFAWAGLAEIALGSLGLLLAYRAVGLHPRAWRLARPMAYNLLKDGWLLMLSDLVMLVYLRVDKIMIGELVGAGELGVYSVAALVAEAFLFIPIVASLSLYPGVVEAKAVSAERFAHCLQRYYNLMALLGYAVALPLSLLAGWLVPVLFGAAYGQAGPMLVGLAWAGMFVNLATARSYFLTAMNWTRLHFVTDLIGCGANVALNLVLIPRYGGLGAVVASVISYGLAAYGLCFLLKPLRPTGVMMTRALLRPKPW